MDSLHWVHCLALHALNHREYFAMLVYKVHNVQGPYPYCTYYIAQCTSYDKQFHCTCCTAIIISCCTEIDSLHRVGSAANAYIALLALNHREYFAQFVQTISLHNKLQKLEDASCVLCCAGTNALHIVHTKHTHQLGGS